MFILTTAMAPNGWLAMTCEAQPCNCCGKCERRPDDVDAVLAEPESETTSHSSGLPLVFGHTPDGRYILVSFLEVDDDTIYPVTAYPVPEPSR
ncbi:MAG: hypothetical protein R3C59_04410 [Planctomycetaceae bacterium]